MDSSKVKNGVAGLLTEKPLLPRVIDFVKASDAGPQKAIDVEDEPPQPQYYLFSRERFLSLFEEANPRRNGRGLQNLGNTCFFNSVLQVLMHTAPLQKFLLSKQHTSECKCKKEGTVCTLCLLEQHAVEAFDSSHQPLKPVRLLKHMPQIANRFKSQGRQEDAHEFLIHFLDACHKSLLKQAPEQPVPRPVQQTTSICQLFGGFLRSQVLCLKCKHPSNTFDPFMDISLEVKNASTLQKALDAFTQSEQLRGANKYQCKKCQQKVDATKTFSIHSAPPLLSFQLKRFDFLHGESRHVDARKLKKKVQFPQSLNIAPYTSHKDKEAKYNLYGLVVHCGASAKSGHYIAYAKQNRNWYCFNDEAVKLVNEQEVLKQEAYLLFYQATGGPKAARAEMSKPQAPEELVGMVKQAANEMNKTAVAGDFISTDPQVIKAQLNGATTNGVKHIGEEKHLNGVRQEPRPKSLAKAAKSIRSHLKREPTDKSESSEKEQSEQSSESKKDLGRIPRMRSRPLQKLQMLQFYQATLGMVKRKVSTSSGVDKFAAIIPPPKKQKVEPQDVSQRAAATTDYMRQYGQAEVDAWDMEMQPEQLQAFREAQEKMQPPVQQRDELDREYDVGKKKHKAKKPKAAFNGSSAFDLEEQRRREKKAGGGSKGKGGKGKDGKGGKGGKGKGGKGKSKGKGKGKGGKSKHKGKY